MKKGRKLLFLGDGAVEPMGYSGISLGLPSMFSTTAWIWVAGCVYQPRLLWEACQFQQSRSEHLILARKISVEV